MDSWFENLTRLFADEKLSRRQTMRRAAGTVAGVLLASVLPEQALASSTSTRPYTCKNPFTCNNNYYLCGSNEYGDCYCFTNPNGKGTCGCDTYCNNAKSCTHNADCVTGQFCAIGTCCPGITGICIPKCTKTCRLEANIGGPTAARS